MSKTTQMVVFFISFNALLTVLLIMIFSNQQKASKPVQTLTKMPQALSPSHSTESATANYSKVRLFCWVMTNPKNIETKAVAVWKTWGKRCDKVVFMTTQPTTLVPAVVLNIPEGYSHLTTKSVHAFNYTYHHHFNEYDWFLKTDDDTFVIVENMRYLLSNFPSTDPIYHGYRFKTLVEQGWYSGGGGYVLSREALRRLAEDGFRGDRCSFNTPAEDVAIAMCLENVGVKTGDSRDQLGQERFHALSLWTHLGGDYPGWMYPVAYHDLKKGLTCCSDVSVTFHYTEPREMYIYYYLLYHLRPYDVGNVPLDQLNGNSPNRLQTLVASDLDDSVF